MFTQLCRATEILCMLLAVQILYGFTEHIVPLILYLLYTLSICIYSYTHTHIINNSCDILSPRGKLLQGVDIIIPCCVSYHSLKILQ